MGGAKGKPRRYLLRGLAVVGEVVGPLLGLGGVLALAEPVERVAPVAGGVDAGVAEAAAQGMDGGFAEWFTASSFSLQTRSYAFTKW